MAGLDNRYHSASNLALALSELPLLGIKKADTSAYTNPPELEKLRIEHNSKGLFSGYRQISSPDRDVNLYGTPDMVKNNTTIPLRPLRVAFLTSIRDVGAEERVGQIWHPGDACSYLEGTIEHCLRAIHTDRLGNHAEVVAVITDDLPQDLQKSGYAAAPYLPGDWIFPKDLRNQAGHLAVSITTNVPSTFRALPLDDIEGRAQAKYEFEKRVFDIMVATKADILISDHYLAKIKHLIREDRFGLYGRVLNTHPGITRQDHPAPCPGREPYELAVQHARGLANHLSSEFSLLSGPHYKTGASFHIVSKNIDQGTVLCDAERTIVLPDDSPEEVQFRNYFCSKNLVFCEGLRHYAANVFPTLQPSSHCSPR